MRDGTAEPVSRDQIHRHARGQGNIHFPCSADHEQDWQPYLVDPYSAICDDYTHIHTYIHHGNNPLLRPTGIQIATKSYATLKAMAPTNLKRLIKPPYSIYREQPRSTRIVVAYPRPAFSATNRTNYLPTSFDQQVQVSQGHTSYKNKENRNTEVHGGGGLELVKPAREPASSRPKPCAPLKKSHESCPFAAPCGPRRKKNDRGGQTLAFPSETSRFAPLILAPRVSALPWLVNDRGALRLRRIWCVPTR